MSVEVILPRRGLLKRFNVRRSEVADRPDVSRSPKTAQPEPIKNGSLPLQSLLAVNRALADAIAAPSLSRLLEDGLKGTGSLSPTLVFPKEGTLVVELNGKTFEAVDYLSPDSSSAVPGKGLAGLIRELNAMGQSHNLLPYISSLINGQALQSGSQAVATT